MTDARKINLNDGDPTNLVQPGNDSTIVLKAPEADKPLICKFVRDMRSANKQAYVPVIYYQHRIGPNEKYIRLHPSAKSLGVGPDLEMAAFLDAKKEAAELEKRGEKESDRYKQLEHTIKRFTPKRGGYLYFVEPNSPTIKALKVSVTVLNSLFGREATSFTAEVPSVVEAMKKTAGNTTPYNLTSDSGWVSIHKTGVGMATRYYVTPATKLVSVRAQDGTELEAAVPLKAKVHEKISNSDVTLDDFPDPIEFEKRNLFTEEETRAFITDMIVPDRFLSKDRESSGDKKQITEAGEAEFDKLKNFDSDEFM
jgi:hypothetical protein